MPAGNQIQNGAGFQNPTHIWSVCSACCFFRKCSSFIPHNALLPSGCLSLLPPSTLLLVILVLLSSPSSPSPLLLLHLPVSALTKIHALKPQLRLLNTNPPPAEHWRKPSASWGVSLWGSTRQDRLTPPPPWSVFPAATPGRPLRRASVRQSWLHWRKKTINTIPSAQLSSRLMCM